MLGVYLSIKTNSLTGSNISLFTVYDLSTPLIPTITAIKVKKAKVFSSNLTAP